MFRVLIAIFESKAKSVWFLQHVISEEIKQTCTFVNWLHCWKDCILIGTFLWQWTLRFFSGNTLATICFDAYLHLAGKELLTLVLGQPIREIYKSDRSCELDPERKEENLPSLTSRRTLNTSPSAWIEYG